MKVHDRLDKSLFLSVTWYHRQRSVADLTNLHLYKEAAVFLDSEWRTSINGTQADSTDHTLALKTSLQTQHCSLGLVLLVLVSHFWFCQSVTDTGVVHPVFSFELEVSSFQVNSHNDHMLLETYWLNHEDSTLCWNHPIIGLGLSLGLHFSWSWSLSGVLWSWDYFGLVYVTGDSKSVISLMNLVLPAHLGCKRITAIKVTV